PGAAKVLQDFVRTSRILTIRGGLAGKTVLNADQVGELTKILPREQYIAKVMGSLNMPVTSLVSVLANTIRGFMNVMNAIIEKQGGAADAGDTTSAESTDGATESAGDTDTAPEATATTEDAAAEAATTPEDGAATEGSTEGTGDDSAGAEPA
ncbi:MAG TPA: hypothetical protein VND68_04265, partial [Chloroflexia bacterium]|nr:hypothetical protein [Chloroflexia bacterium]